MYTMYMPLIHSVVQLTLCPVCIYLGRPCSLPKEMMIVMMMILCLDMRNSPSYGMGVHETSPPQWCMRFVTGPALIWDIGVREKLTIMGYGCGPAADPKM